MVKIQSLNELRRPDLQPLESHKAKLPLLLSDLCAYIGSSIFLAVIVSTEAGINNGSFDLVKKVRPL